MAKRNQLELDGIENGFINLRTKPSARLGYSFVPSTAHSTGKAKRLLVFLAGIDVPRSLWQGTFTRLAELARINGLELPPMLTYDRYGVGQSDHDPSDVGKPPEEYHDALEAQRDLRQLLIQVVSQKLGYAEQELDSLRIVFCAHSLGCCIARLYAMKYTGTVEALLLVDSAISSTPAMKFIPDPDNPDDWERRRHLVPERVTPEMCREAISISRKTPLSGYALTTRERIQWTNMPQLLPFSYAPKLRGPESGLPLVTVLINDSEVAIRNTSKVCKLCLRSHTRKETFCVSNH